MKARHMRHDKIFGQVKSSLMIQCAILTFFIILSGHSSVYGVVGCNCNDPDRDVARFFPESTGYKVIFTSIKKKGGEKLMDAVEARLGDKNNSYYWGLDEPFTIYEVLAGKKKIGYLHGVNQKGQVGSFQVFLTLDPLGTITGFFTRKMTNQYATQLRDTEFEEQFIGLTIKDFDQFDVVSGKSSGKVDGLKNPVPEAQEDFTAILRAVKKNLILMDELIFSEQQARASQETRLK